LEKPLKNALSEIILKHKIKTSPTVSTQNQHGPRGHEIQFKSYLLIHFHQHYICSNVTRVYIVFY